MGGQLAISLAGDERSSGAINTLQKVVPSSASERQMDEFSKLKNANAVPVRWSMVYYTETDVSRIFFVGTFPKPKLLSR